MQIEKLKVKKGQPYIPDRDNTLLFDLGWYTDSDINGEYFLQLVDGYWNEVKSFSSKDRFLIKKTLEEWLEEYQAVN